MINADRRRYLRNVGVACATAIIAPVGSNFSSLNVSASVNHSTGNNACNSLLSHRLRPLMDPDERPLCELYADKVLLIVNTASQCGFTPQFEGLEALHQRYAAEGLRVLGFPSADFHQELDSETEVAEFCELNYGVSFPMFQKVSVISPTAHPLYQQLAEATGTYPRWNFNKYLVNRQGEPVRHYHSSVKPLDSSIVADIESLL